MDCAMEQNLKLKKVVHIESARRQIMHIVLLKRLVTIMVSSTSAQPTPQIKLSTLEFFDNYTAGYMMLAIYIVHI